MDNTLTEAQQRYQINDICECWEWDCSKLAEPGYHPPYLARDREGHLGQWRYVMEQLTGQCHANSEPYRIENW